MLARRGPAASVTARLRAATRGSALARWQTDHVAALLRAAHPGLVVEAVVVETEGDRRLDVPISSFGGKGVFAKEVQAAVLDGRADIAVHSAKDLPSLTVDGLLLAAVPERGDPRDALVGSSLAELPEGGVVATGSNRRRVQLAARRPDLRFVELRGNMQTRLAKAADHHAIVVAAVALQRLGLAEHLREVLEVEVMVPQVAQGALAVECRAEDGPTVALLASIEHGPSRRRVDAERAFLAELGGDCDLPAGAHATLVGEQVRVDGVLAPGDGSRLERVDLIGPDPVAVGAAVARMLLRALGG
ncbi:MAG: hydroxymethylbilane synthase [Acidimicrobiales bacterium]|nr:hydroxymethylbilane synthase [Acidimicrobiales bacterium]